MTITTKFNRGDTVYLPTVKIQQDTIESIHITVVNSCPFIKYKLRNHPTLYTETVLFASEKELRKFFDYS